MNSILGRLTTIALIFIVGTSVAVSVVGYRLTVNFEKERFRDHFNLMTSYLASNSELGVMLGDKKILAVLSKNMLAVKDVQVVEIVGLNGVSLVRLANENPPDVLDVVSAPVFSETMGPGDSPFLGTTSDKEVLGTVKISFSYTGLAQLKHTLALQFSFLSFFLACGAVILYWLLSRAIIAPLQEILDVAGKVSRGQMSVRAKGGTLREINTLATAINDMLDALATQRQKLNFANENLAKQQVLAEVGKFSMIVAHEIKNPLAIIKGSLDVLRKQGTLELEMKNRLMSFIDGEVKRINKLVEDFLLFARPQTPSFRVVGMSELASTLEQRLKLLSSSVPVDTDFSAIQVERESLCDLHLFERALFNVVRNAIDVSTSQNSITVKAFCSSRCLVFTVKDNGPGISPKDLDHIFEPFYSKKAKGTGLGLAIVKDIIKVHGGKISMTNCKSGGALFTLSIPLIFSQEVGLDSKMATYKK